MEVIKKTLISLYVIFSSFCAFAISSSEVVFQERVVRFSLWAQTDVYPGYFDSDKVSEKEKKLNQDKSKELSYEIPIKKIKEIAPFLLGGMVYGWTFEYVPYDKSRSVNEYFDFNQIKEFSESDVSKIKYEAPWIQDDKLFAWIEYDRSEVQINLFNHWATVNNPCVKGIGYAKLSEGFDGIKKACEDAIKNGVREYFRTKIKTKPKEISGRVLVCREPVIAIDSGRYKVLLDFFIQKDRIIEYKTF